MTLRTRLILAFLLLSVVPLGLVTFYSYRSNVDAMHEVAAREADLLSAVLNQRMQVITMQLSDRIEHLIDVSTPPPAPSTPATTPAQPATPPPAATPAISQEQATQQVANALGEAALLLNTVNVQGFRGFQMTGRPGGPGGNPGAGGGTGRGDGRGGNPSGAQTHRPPPPGTAGASGGLVPPDAANPNKPATPRGSATPQPGVTPPAAPGAPTTTFVIKPPSTTGGRGANANANATGAPPDPSKPPTQFVDVTPKGADSRTIVTTENGMKIDLSQIRRDIYRQILPSQNAESLTPEERRRVASEVNQRMLGIAEGIKLSAAEIERKAKETQQHADEIAKSSSTSAAGAKAKTPAPVAPGAPVVPPPPVAAAAPVAPTAPPGTTTSPTTAVTTKTPVTATTPVTQAPAPPQTPLKRTAEFNGNRLDIKFERDGQVVRTANAEINLPNMLMTVFASTPREQGEVPFAVDKDGKVYAQSDEDKKRVEDFGSIATPNGPLGKQIVREWVVVTTAGPAGSGLRFGIARSTGDSLAALRHTAGRNALFGLLFIGVALVGVVPLSSRLTRNLSKLTEGVARISRGDYHARVELKANDEVAALATAFNRMAADVEKHQRSAVEQERIRRELELGRQIQHDMLPHGSLHFGLTEINGMSVPAREVGGDFFNYFQLANGHIAMLVGDVSGKGVGAALLMANIQASLRTRLALGQDLAAVADEIDRDIDQNSPQSLYATLFVGTLDPVTRVLRYVNCGHNPQFVLRKAGGLERMASTGLPVGLLAGRGYEQVSLQLDADDRLFFYTDGCVEAENEAGDFFGTERLEAALSSGGHDPSDVLAQVERAVEQFRGSRELLDDVTVMAVRVG
jgi:serine phosphatase RsbU (regulator of sigma subunit)